MPACAPTPSPLSESDPSCVGVLPSVGVGDGAAIHQSGFFPVYPRDGGHGGRVRLSSRERAVATLVARGCSNKLVAFELGVGVGTVATHVKRAKAKLGVRTRVELVTRLAGGAARQLPSARDVASSARALTGAERTIVAGILAARSNADIARSRGRSIRTIANQVATAFRKLGVRSRAELAAAWVAAFAGEPAGDLPGSRGWTAPPPPPGGAQGVP